MSHKLECIACREMREFEEYADYPICEMCKKREKEKFEYEHSDEYFRKPFKTSKKEKRPIPDNIRWAVWERDNFTCRHCGSRKNLTIDHIVTGKQIGKAHV